jgi:hypothetical protein
VAVSGPDESLVKRVAAACKQAKAERVIAYSGDYISDTAGHFHG